MITQEQDKKDEKPDNNKLHKRRRSEKTHHGRAGTATMETDDQTTRRRQRAARLQSPRDTHGSWRRKKGRNMACGESSTVCAAEGEESQRGRKKAKHRHWPPLKKLGFTEMKWRIVREMRHKEKG
ncbi:hypothetical protein PIB30_057362 [Stylosanthes scabra]|uniref:Uncharacterized protein n=1 Tax=Stylosanthes scabra TaxID=79078 RepID=A0ABU6ZIB6_9FABA|nr:hypothetical protein [Stylosanthes scabra]